MLLNEEKAKTVFGQIKKICLDHGIHFDTKESYKDGCLDILGFNEIAIKVHREKVKTT